MPTDRSLNARAPDLVMTDMSLSIEQISRFIYAAVVGSLVLDIGGAFGLKYTVSALLLVWVLVLIAKTGIRRDLSIEFGVLLYFGLSLCYSLFRGIELSDIYGQLSFVVYFTLLFVTLTIPRRETEQSFRRMMIFASLIVIGTFTSILLFPVSAVAWNFLGDNYRLGYLGLQSIGDLTLPNVYYRWSMWLVPAFIVCIGRHSRAAVLIGLAALITLSTSVIVFTLLGAGLLAFVFGSQFSKNLRSMTVVAILAVVILVVFESVFSVSGDLYQNIVSKFSASSVSTSVKIGHIEGVMQSMQSSIPNMLFGTGVGSEFFSPGVDGYLVNIEVSHFNFVRQFGLIGGAVFFGYVFYVVFCAYRTDALGKRWSIGLLMLFIAAGTNPLLMSPVFMVVLVTVRSYVARFCVENRNA